MGRGSQQTDPASGGAGQGAGVFTWEEVQKHSHKGDQWLVIDRKVYNISQWVKRHPGGLRVISHYAGEDATDAFRAFHPQPAYVRKFLKPLLIGELAASEPCQDHQKSETVIQDFRALHDQVEKMGLFRSSPLFFCMYLGHIILLEALALLLLWNFGAGWVTFFACSVLLATSQAQAGWLQHDFGHLSVFRNSFWDHLVHQFVIGHLKGASANWWNHRHFQHHAKPNVFQKDPDVNMINAFVVGEVQPVEYGIKKLKYLPYNHQHKYFFLIGPPLLIPVYFQLQIMHTMISRRLWQDFAWSMSYYLRYCICFIPAFGFVNAFVFICYISIILFMESHWFVWVTQMSHIPMNIDYEKHDDWLTMQLKATCNIEASAFNDWFSGHLNFQIEHHLFPMMPRHNYRHAAPLVEALCKKHGLPYTVKPLWTAFSDIVSSLQKSGEMWLDAYLHK
uniref:Cytochrome b5 heme-binding domain-containing protein n=1 Tax=Denticeps clupeoides TaxID=299321 RepID=A0AAY4DXQ4_9TELE